MPALAMGIGYAGYTLGLWGYCLARGYDVTLLQLIDLRHVPRWADIAASQVPAGQTWPTGAGTTAAPAETAAAAKLGQGVAGLARAAASARNRKAP